MPDPKKLYDTLTKDGYDMGSYDEFTKSMTSPQSQQKLYSTLTKDGYDMGSFNDFSIGIGQKKNDGSTPSTNSSGAISNGASITGTAGASTSTSLNVNGFCRHAFLYSTF